jgi:predicted negative regulator of RcsB-dependent stress response
LIVDLLSEDEQWEALKRWLRTNGPAVLVMVALMFLALFGWKWWQRYQDQQAAKARDIYEQVLSSFDQEKIDVAVVQIETLRKEHPKSGYLPMAELAAARAYVAFNQLDKAAASLERVANTAADKNLRPVARLRLARVQAAQGQYDKALATLGTADMGPHQSTYLEIHGDVLLAKGDKAGALKDYEAARKVLTEDQAGADGVGQILDLKISDLKATST